MSVKEPFLRGGIPFTANKKLSEQFDRSYDAWSVVVYFPRRWCYDVRERRAFCPCLVLYFGRKHRRGGATEGTTAVVPPAASSEEELELFKYSTIDTVKHGSSADIALAVGTEIKSTVEAIPQVLRPSVDTTVPVQCMWSTTHEDVHVVEGDRLLDIAARSLSTAAVGGLSFQVAGVRYTTDGDCAPLRHPHDAVQWCLEQVPFLRAVESPLLPQAAALYRILYAAAETDAVDALCTAPWRGSDAEGAAPRPVTLPTRHRPLSWATTSLAVPDSEWRHCVLRQPQLAGRLVSSDGIIQGAPQPQPPCLEVHIHRDPGDVLFTTNALALQSLPVEEYVDLLPPSDGELVVIPGHCVEGISFHDLDIAVAVWRESSRPPLSSFSRDKQHAAWCNSCSPMYVPRIEYHAPTGTVARATPVDEPRMTVQVSAPTEDMVRSAAAALELLVRAARPLLSGEVALDAKVLPPLEVPPISQLMHCAWCSRQRVKLLRCGGCRVASYCCKEHQMQDWKGGHKTECSAWKEARLQLDQLPTTAASEIEAGMGRINVASAAASCAATVVEFLMRWLQRGPLAEQSELTVHLAALPSSVSVALFLDAFAKVCPSLLRAAHHTHRVSKIKMVLTALHADPQRRNAVAVLSASNNEEDGAGPASLEWAAATGVIGDVWREQQPPSPSTATSDHHEQNSGCKDSLPTKCLVRIVSEKYHNFAATTMFDKQNRPIEGAQPHAVLFLGDSNGDGITFFHAASEIIAGDLLGSPEIAVLVTESSLVACQRTVSALKQRAAMTERSEHVMTLLQQVTPVMAPMHCRDPAPSFFRVETSDDPTGNHAVALLQCPTVVDGCYLLSCPPQLSYSSGSSGATTAEKRNPIETYHNLYWLTFH